MPCLGDMGKELVDADLETCSGMRGRFHGLGMDGLVHLTLRVVGGCDARLQIVLHGVFQREKEVSELASGHLIYARQRLSEVLRLF